VETSLSCLKLSETAIKADKQKRQLLNWFPLTIIPKQNRLWRLKTKKAQPTAASTAFPPKNTWLALRAAKEKAALAGDNSGFSPFLVSIYNEARTYFQENA